MRHKKEGILKLIILYKGIWGVAEIFFSISFYRFLGRNGNDPLKALAAGLHLNPENVVVGTVLKHIGSLDSGLLFVFTVVIFFFGLGNIVEAWGLHRRYRWAEWLTVIATSALVPYELYHVVTGFSILKLTILVINVLIVYYLAKHKELFKKWRNSRPASQRAL
ncbi:MAG: DUF2127 domain-containing protein [Thermodesulfobacteriota bacterium]